MAAVDILDNRIGRGLVGDFFQDVLGCYRQKNQAASGCSVAESGLTLSAELA